MDLCNFLACVSVLASHTTGYQGVVAMAATDVITWDEERAKLLGIDYDPSEFWIERTKTVRKQIADRKETLSNYESVQKQLQELLKQPRHPVMVPCGKLAMMPGHIVNTNDIMAFLGDGWFANRSVSQCVAIVDRRLEVVRKDYENLKTEEEDCIKRLNLLSHFADIGAGGDGPRKAKKVATSAMATAAPPAAAAAPAIPVSSVDDRLRIIAEMEKEGKDTTGVRFVDASRPSAEADSEAESEEDEEEEEEEEEEEGVLGDDEIQRRLSRAGFFDEASKECGSSGGSLVSKLDAMVSTKRDEAEVDARLQKKKKGAEAAPLFANPSDIFAAYDAYDRVDAGAPATESSSKHVAFSEEAPATTAAAPNSVGGGVSGVLKDRSRVTQAQALPAEAAPTVVRETPPPVAPQPTYVTGDVVMRETSCVPPPPPPMRTKPTQNRSNPNRKRWEE